MVIVQPGPGGCFCFCWEAGLCSCSSSVGLEGLKAPCWPKIHSFFPANLWLGFVAGIEAPGESCPLTEFPHSLHWFFPQRYTPLRKAPHQRSLRSLLHPSSQTLALPGRLARRYSLSVQFSSSVEMSNAPGFGAAMHWSGLVLPTSTTTAGTQRLGV